MKKVKELNQNGDISILLIILIIILLILGVGFYVWQRNDDDSSGDGPVATATETTEETAEEEATEPAEPICTEPSSEQVENIKASITSGNTAAMEAYFTNPVKVILAASGGVGDRTPAEAVGDITSFISGTSGWDFALPAATIGGYQSSGYATYFPANAVVGKDSSTKLISFSFNCDGDVNVVFESGQEQFIN